MAAVARVIAVDPTTHRVYVGSSQSSIFVLDGFTGATIATIPLKYVPISMAIDPGTHKLFVFGTTDFNVNGLQDLNLRTILGGGFGWHAIAKPNQQLDILGGVVWTHENYGQIPAVLTTTPITPAVPAEVNSFAALDFGEQYTRKLGASSSFTEQGYIFPDLADTSQYRATFNGSLSTKIKSFLSWQTTISDVYVTNPPPSTKDNDFILTTGLGFTFTRK